ncbi:MAG: EamA family transporter [Chthoniobacterales bacterium]|nr:EamA family transporter [Chthoniobacterales bacterium]
MNFSSKFSSSTFINYLLLFGCGLMWGSLYFFNKMALESFSTPMIVAGGTSIGALTLTLVFLIGGERAKPLNPPRSFWQCFPDFILIGVLELTIPCLLIAWAEEQLPSSATAILIGTVPLFATLMEALFIKGNTLSAAKIAGILLGFLGVIILARGGSSIADLLTATTGSLPLLPVLAVLGAALCYPFTLLLIKIRLGPSLGPIHAAQGILLGAAITALPLMLFITKPWRMTSFHPLPSAWLALILLGVFCEGLVYILYVQLIKRAGLSFASTCNYLTPLIGSFIGIFFAGEKMTLALIEALVLILFSLWLSSGKKQKNY